MTDAVKEISVWEIKGKKEALIVVSYSLSTFQVFFHLCQSHGIISHGSQGGG